MIFAILEDRCTSCGTCAAVCPSNVIASDARGGPRIARLDDCQTCFLCELYCAADAIYVDPDCEAPAAGVDLADLVARGVVGKFRRDSGWDEWADDPRYENAHWRMDGIFARGRAA
jgi:NAD-dependent dihydropyrimidine dehydrogenase PreA subunit